MWANDGKFSVFDYARMNLNTKRWTFVFVCFCAMIRFQNDPKYHLSRKPLILIIYVTRRIIIKEHKIWYTTEQPYLLYSNIAA